MSAGGQVHLNSKHLFICTYKEVDEGYLKCSTYIPLKEPTTLPFITVLFLLESTVFFCKIMIWRQELFSLANKVIIAMKL